MNIHLRVLVAILAWQMCPALHSTRQDCYECLLMFLKSDNAVDGSLDDARESCFELPDRENKSCEIV